MDLMVNDLLYNVVRVVPSHIYLELLRDVLACSRKPPQPLYVNRKRLDMLHTNWFNNEH